MKLKIYTKCGTQSQDKELTDFRAFDGDKGLSDLHQVVKAYQANLRQGNACAKDRGDVAGSGKKPYRQKGTGSARHGEKRSPIWRKGGVVFGPLPRDYSQKINKKQKNLAFQRALFNSVQSGQISLMEEIHLSESKTKAFCAILNKIKPHGRVLLIDVAFEDNVILSARNIARLHMIQVHDVNALDFVRYPHVIMSEKAFEAITQRAKI